jgi:hypothetical protein
LTVDVGLGVGVAVGFGVVVGLGVGVGVAVGFGVVVGLGVAVGVDVGFGVAVGVGVAVGFAVAVAVTGATVAVAVGVGVGVAVGVVIDVSAGTSADEDGSTFWSDVTWDDVTVASQDRTPLQPAKTPARTKHDRAVTVIRAPRICMIPPPLIVAEAARVEYPPSECPSKRGHARHSRTSSRPDP